MENVPTDKLIDEINKRLTAVDIEKLGDFGSHRVWAYNDVKEIIKTLQEEVKKERIKKLEDMRKTSREYRDAVVKHIETKRELPVFKGEQLHDFKNELNTMKQVLDIQNWPDVQYVLFEKFALVFAAWGMNHPSHQDVNLEKELRAYLNSDEYQNTCGNGSLLIARHFFNLGVLAKNE
jgi:phosphoglycerate-specific signal transduction histidine kinase